MNYGTLYGLLIFVGLLAIGLVAEIVVEDPGSGMADVMQLDPNRLPPTAAGISGRRGQPLGCEGIVYQAAYNGIKYVRESGGGVFFAAEINRRFGYYKMKNGRLVSVDNAEVGEESMAKLKYALYNCEGQLMSSGTYIYTRADQSADSRVARREGQEVMSTP